MNTVVRHQQILDDNRKTERGAELLQKIESEQPAEIRLTKDDEMCLRMACTVGVWLDFQKSASKINVRGVIAKIGDTLCLPI